MEKIEGRRRRGRQRMRWWWHHQLNGHVFQQTPGDSEWEGSLVCCSPWGRKVRHNWVTAQHNPYILKSLHLALIYVIFSFLRNEYSFQLSILPWETSVSELSTWPFLRYHCYFIDKNYGLKHQLSNYCGCLDYTFRNLGNDCPVTPWIEWTHC